MPFLRQTCALVLGLAVVAGLATQAHAEVGVSVEISQPGVYGRVDIGQFPAPRIILPQPVIIQPVRERPRPVYMWVPPGHRKHWSKHCARYNACGVPVYFVQDRWYQDHVVAHAHDDEHHDDHDHGGPGKGHGHGNGKSKGKGH